MSYRHYETEGLIIGHRNLGEANRLYQVLTPDFGLINILAQSVRKDKSKLRYHLENFSFAYLTLVHGREFWRIVGAQDLGLAVKPKKEAKKEAIAFLKKISLVLFRLIHGEEASHFIYQDLKQAWLLIVTQTDGQNEVAGESLALLEIFVLTRLLAELGYLNILPELKTIFSSPAFSWREVEAIKNFKLKLIGGINESLASTQL